MDEFHTAKPEKNVDLLVSNFLFYIHFKWDPMIKVFFLSMIHEWYEIILFNTEVSIEIYEVLESFSTIKFKSASLINSSEFSLVSETLCLI